MCFKFIRDNKNKNKNQVTSGTINILMPIPVVERSKAWVCSHSPAGIAGSNPAGGMDVCLL